MGGAWGVGPNLPYPRTVLAVSYISIH